MRSLTARLDHRRSRDAGGCHVARKSIAADRDRLAPKRLLAEVDIGLPTFLEQLELAIMFDWPGRSS